MNSNFLHNIGLTKQILEDKKISGKEVSLKAGNTIFQSGDKPDVFLLLIEGEVRVDITTKSGRDMVLYRIQEGQPCVMAGSALMNNEYYFARAICETNVIAIAISLANFYKAIEHSHTFMRYILDDYSKRMLSLVKFIDKTASKDVLYDLCSWLLSQTEYSSIINMTHSRIAQEIGTAREVVSRKLYFLEAEGAIETSRGKITIINRTYLEKLTLF